MRYLSFNKLLGYLILFLSFVSVVFFFTLFSSIRFEPDEMRGSVFFQHYSYFEVVRYFYLYDTLRPIYALFLFFGIGFSSNTYLNISHIFILYLLFSGLFVYAIYMLLKEVFLLSNLSYRKKILLIAFSILFLISIYFLTTNRIEIFGELTNTINHLVPVIFTLLAARLLLKNEQEKMDYIWLTIYVFFIAGGTEHIAPLIISTLSVCLLILFLKEKNLTNNYKLTKVFFFIGILSLFFLFLIITPGTWNRYQGTQQYIGIHSPERKLDIIRTIKAIFQPYKLVNLMFLAFIWLFFFKLFDIKINFKIKWDYFLVMLISVIIVCSFSTIFAYHTLYVDRMWFLFDMVLLILVSIIMVKILSSREFPKTYYYIGTVYVLFILISFSIRHTPVLLRYQSKYDSLISVLQQKPKNKLIKIKALPFPDLVAQTSLNTDPDNDFNKLFCSFYHIEAKISAIDTSKENLLLK